MTPPKARTYSGARRITAGRARTCRRRRTPDLGPRPRHEAELAAPGHRGLGSPRRPAARRPVRPRDRGRGIRSAASPVSVTGEVLCHRQYCGEATEGGGPRAGEHGLGVLATRLAQVGVQVDQARKATSPSASITSAPEGASATRDPSRRTGLRSRHRTAAPLMTKSFGALMMRSLAGEQVGTDILMATPAETWSRTDWAESAASAAISRPRFIGPGWQIGASGLRTSSRSRVSP